MAPQTRSRAQHRRSQAPKKRGQIGKATSHTEKKKIQTKKTRGRAQILTGVESDQVARPSLQQLDLKGVDFRLAGGARRLSPTVSPTSTSSLEKCAYDTLAAEGYPQLSLQARNAQHPAPEHTIFVLRDAWLNFREDQIRLRGHSLSLPDFTEVERLQCARTLGSRAASNSTRDQEEMTRLWELARKEKLAKRQATIDKRVAKLGHGKRLILKSRYTEQDDATSLAEFLAFLMDQRSEMFHLINEVRSDFDSLTGCYEKQDNHTA